jgi:mono/diheme cytochrome c family protein
MRPLPRAVPTLVLAVLLGVGACGDGARPEIPERPPLSAEDLAAGAAVYEARCASCHGPEGTGSEVGPPLVHRVYEPRHHADFAFRLAIRQGVRAHHWRFGDMPPVPDLDDEQIGQVIGYIRHLQRQAGIF